MDQVLNEVLRPFGALRNFRGYHQLVIALEIVMENPSRLEYMTSMYIDIAGKCNCTYISVERNIRTLIEHMWLRNPAYMMELAGHSLIKRPTVSQFLDILALSVQRVSTDRHIAF